MPDDAYIYSEEELARAFDVTTRAVAFYAGRGLLRPRRKDHQRRYSKDDHARIALVVRAKSLGFSLKEIGAILADQRGGSGGYGLEISRDQCGRRIAELEQQLRDVEAALTELRRLYTAMYLQTRSK